MKRDEARRLLHAYLDGELDPPTSLELEAVLAVDPDLRVACERLREMSAGIRENAQYHRAPQALMARVSRSTTGSTSRFTEAGTPGWQRFLPHVVGVATVAAVLGIAVTFWSLRGGADERLVEEALASHSRSVLGNRLIDVASSDQHTVKPWLSSRLNFSPTVTDYAAQGFELAGARVDYLDGQAVAAMVYRHRQHVIDVFVWPASHDRMQRTDARRGFNIESFSQGGMNYWVVSDLNQTELSTLTRLLLVQSAVHQ